MNHVELARTLSWREDALLAERETNRFFRLIVLFVLTLQ